MGLMVIDIILVYIMLYVLLLHVDQVFMHVIYELKLIKTEISGNVVLVERM